MSSVVLWLSSFTGVHFLPVVSVSISPSCSGATAGMYFPFLALFLPVVNKPTVTDSQVGWASPCMWQFSSRFSLCCSIKSFCSPLNGDFEICKEVGEVLRTGELSIVSCFTGECNSFAFPLAGMCSHHHNRWQMMLLQKVQKRDNPSPQGKCCRVVQLTGSRGLLSWGRRQIWSWLHYRIK